MLAKTTASYKFELLFINGEIYIWRLSNINQIEK